MTRHTRSHRLTLCTLVAFGGVISMLANACSSDREGYAQAPPSSFSGEEAGAGPEVACTTVKCSRDLRSVLSGCDDTVVVETCATGYACAEGACTPDACKAAEIEKGSTGCAFHTLPPIERTYGSDSCFAAFVANTWDTPVNVTAEYGGQPLDLSQSIYQVTNDGTRVTHTLLSGPVPPGQTAVVFLSQGPAAMAEGFCPQGVTPALADDPIITTSGITKSFRLSTDKPVSAYSVYPYGGAATMIPSATLLFPTSAWTTNYIAVDGFPGTSSEAKTFVQIVAQEDDTEVRMLPVTNLAAGEGFPAGAAGKTQTWRLARGQVVQFTQNSSLAGSPIESNKPIGVFGGTQCTRLPLDATLFCDTLGQQIPPLSQWGSEYALVPYMSRLEGGKGTSSEVTGNESVPYRLVGAVDGTELTYDPVIPVGAPRVLAKGQVATFMSNHYVTVKSQDAAHPFYASVFMTGSTYNGTQTYGDPDFVNLVPSDQFLDRYVFATDFTYADTNLTIVRRATSK